MSAAPEASASEAAVGHVRDALLQWYDVEARELPWRGVGDPWATWVSEVMLQQTRVETVRPYYARWMARFPTPRALAEADPDEVLRHWQGLGYYSRARNLQAGARAVVERHGGQVPGDLDALRALPGVGPYTAGAIASIAFGIATPLVDGNVERVLARIFAVDDDPKSTAGRRRIWALAEQLVDKARPGDLNQALMELGALVCMPRNPRCLVCPVRDVCVALADGRVDELPVRAAKKPPPDEGWWALLWRDAAGRLLVGQRAAGGLLGGLWEPPLVRDVGTEPVDALRAQLGVDAHVVALEPVVHVFSHRRWTATPLALRTLAPEPSALPGYTALRWVADADRGELAWSTFARKLLAAADAQPDVAARSAR